MRDFPLGDGRRFYFSIDAEDPFCTADAVKVMMHLVTFAHDFNPLNEKHAAVFSLQRMSE